MIQYAFMMQALQLVDSELPQTRHFWRIKVWKFSDKITADPRPLREVLGAWPDWRRPEDAAPELGTALAAARILTKGAEE